MKRFKDGAPLRLSLPWEPPVHFDEQAWKHSLGDRLEDAGLYDLLGYFNCYDISGGQIHFYMHTPLRPVELKKQLRESRPWRAFLMANPEATLAWAGEVREKAQ
jgi:hypothetical protein